MTTEHSYTLTVQQYNYLLPVFGIAAQGRTRLLARCGGYYFIGTYEDYLDALNRCIYI